jgi:hypothetical protein
MLDLSDRDRVTAILTLADRVARGGLDADDFYESSATLLQDGIWAARTLLEALDTIDKAREGIADTIGALHDVGCDSDNHADGCKGCQVLRVLESDPRLKALSE